MANIKPKTFNEILALKKTYSLKKYFSDITESTLEDVFNFLKTDKANTVVANRKTLSLVEKGIRVRKSFTLTPVIDKKFDKITINNDGIKIKKGLNTYDIDSGSSSNNNNNNNS